MRFGVGKMNDDKNLVIFAVTILGLFSMFAIPEAKEIIIAIVSGLFGVAVGKSV